MLFELVAAGSLIYWLLVVLFVVAIITTIESNSFSLASSIVIGSLMFLQLFTNTNPLGYVYNHPATSLCIVFGYFVVGALWAVAKWYFFCIGAMNVYSILRTQWIEHHNSNNVNQFNAENMSLADKKSMIRDIAASMPSKYGRQIPPLVSHNKSVITGWIAFWPFSAAWTLTNDPIRHITRATYVHIADTMQSISNRIFSKKFNELN